jgi:regulatory protein
MASGKGPRTRPALDQKRLDELALRYVGRYATTRGKLRTYLARKLRERGWSGNAEPDVEAIAERFAELGYIDDAAYALNKSQALAGRGYGKRRLTEKLRAAGVDEAHSISARAHADREALAAALRFAERRRIGPFALEPVSDPRQRDKAVAAMVRAGHGFGLARAIVTLPPGEEFDRDALMQKSGLEYN